MDRIEFLTAIFKFYGKDVSKNKELLTQYDLALSTREPIDWDKLYQLVLKETESRILPAPKWFRDKFDRCYKQEGSYITPDRIKVRLVLDKYSYDYETYHLNTTIAEVKQRFIKKYQDKFKDLFVYDEDKYQWVKV